MYCNVLQSFVMFCNEITAKITAKVDSNLGSFKVLKHTDRRCGRPTATLLLAPAEGWGPFGPCWGPSAPSPCSPQKNPTKKKEIQDGRHGPKMAASSRYGSN